MPISARRWWMSAVWVCVAVALVHAGGQAAVDTARQQPVHEPVGQRVTDLLARPLPVDDKGLHFKASASAVALGSTSVDVQLIVEVTGRDLVLDLSGQRLQENNVALGYLAVDPSGKPLARGLEHVALRPPEQGWAAIGARGWRYLTTLTLPSGRHQLRVAASEARGQRSGSVFLAIDVPDPSTPSLAMGDLLLTATGAGAMATVGKVILDREVMAKPPTARRQFAASETITVFVAIRANPPARTGDIAVATIVRAADGGEVWRTAAKYPASALALGSAGHVASVPLAAFAPGSYVLTIEATPRGSPSPALAREVALVVRPPEPPER